MPYHPRGLRFGHLLRSGSPSTDAPLHRKQADYRAKRLRQAAQQAAPPPPSPLERENRRLVEELKRLKEVH